ncbi:hypothetical protein NQ317_016049 [Molorchus minor]|uniref:Uncharacterized protein n=1 Tax=Molorchus minor TaxID=1323400 RepID=A0ABQ9JRH8_9CUCU|nr:hypothetical protein NQ317_016049 [Molorchus minor]
MLKSENVELGSIVNQLKETVGLLKLEVIEHNKAGFKICLTKKECRYAWFFNFDYGAFSITTMNAESGSPHSALHGLARVANGLNISLKNSKAPLHST